MKNAREETVEKYVGKVFPTNMYGYVRVLQYINYHDVRVLFINTGNIISISCEKLKSGSLRNPEICKPLQLYETYRTNNYGDVLLIKYTDATNVTVKFLNTGNTQRVSAGSLRLGSIADRKEIRRRKNLKKSVEK